ncbi:MAG: acyl-CoA thioesterase [Alphaproteobacteria bacterium]|nr:acyl-CoA thioesterase [Alphaproteobacteria bacterium]
MYPIFRFTKEMLLFRRASKLALGEVHISHHLCWPWDVDPWMELNNGRTLTLYDLGRLPMVHRSGLIAALRKRGWGMAVAGASVRYRKRVRMFQSIRMQSVILGWDKRFFYFQQSMWNGAEATSSILCRMAITGDNGLVAPAPERVVADLGWPETSPALPVYVTQWIKAEGERPWPPAP